VIGAPGFAVNTGQVTLWYGDTAWSFNRGTSSISGVAASGDRFGSAIAVGDFDGDGKDDWAVGAPGDADELGGSINVFDNSGLDRQWSQDTSQIPGVGEAGDEFGASLAAGDLNCDGYDDLVIGSPGENDDAGRVVVIYGKPNFLDLSDAVIHSWDQDDAGTSDPESGDRFGDSLAIGNFSNTKSSLTGKNCNALAVGAPGEDVGDIIDGGAVSIVYGGPTESVIRFSQIWHQNSDGMAGGAEMGDEFGHALSIGNIDDDKYDDLIIGIPNENGKGYLQLMHGSGSGLTTEGNQLETTYMDSEAHAGNAIGYAVAGSSIRRVVAGGIGVDEGRHVDVGVGISFDPKNVPYGTWFRVKSDADRFYGGYSLTTPRPAK
jgi:hypothetical protein